MIGSQVRQTPKMNVLYKPEEKKGKGKTMTGSNSIVMEDGLVTGGWEKRTDIRERENR